MAKTKIYAVKKGRQTGIFTSWADCRSVVEGYPGAEYKSFTDANEACAYLGTSLYKKEESKICADPGQVIAYVDGSFDVRIGRYAYGCILILPSGEIVRKSGGGNNPESAGLRNVTGEMLGAMNAVLWAMKHGYEAIDIRYDYMGIEKWALGQWKTNNELTKKYADYMRQCRQRIRMTFKKIQAHTGDYYNEEADKLAKSALKSE